MRINNDIKNTGTDNTQHKNKHHTNKEVKKLSRAIKFVMDEVTYKRLNSIANRNNSSMAHVVRELIHMSIDTREEWELPKLVPQQENPANK